MNGLRQIHNKYVSKLSQQTDELKKKQLLYEYSQLVWWYGLHDLGNYQEIKDCPFCGQPAQFQLSNGVYSIRCSNWQCIMHQFLVDYEQWNMRYGNLKEFTKFDQE